MIAQALIALLSELVFGAVKGMHRDFTSEVDGYLNQRGFSTRPTR